MNLELIEHIVVVGHVPIIHTFDGPRLNFGTNVFDRGQIIFYQMATFLIGDWSAGEGHLILLVERALRGELDNHSQSWSRG